jgi:hypothetical protein
MRFGEVHACFLSLLAADFSDSCSQQGLPIWLVHFITCRAQAIEMQ